MHFLGCSPTSSKQQSPRRPILFALNTPAGTGTLVRPTIDNSRRRRDDLPNTKFDEAQTLATSLLNVVSATNEFRSHNQVRRGLPDHRNGDRSIGSHPRLNGTKHVWRAHKAVSHHRSPPDSDEILTNSKNLTRAGTHVHPKNKQGCSQNATPATAPVHRFDQTTSIEIENAMHVPPPGPYQVHYQQEKQLTTLPARPRTTVGSMAASLDKRVVADDHRGLRRSPSIAIKKGRPDPQAEAERAELANAVREYNWATWRLYDRIVSHRQRNPQVHPLSPDNVSTDHDHEDHQEVAFASVRDKQEDHGRLDDIKPIESSSSSNTDDDGIFMMDF